MITFLLLLIIIIFIIIIIIIIIINLLLLSMKLMLVLMLILFLVIIMDLKPYVLSESLLGFSNVEFTLKDLIKSYCVSLVALYPK